jgi:uracil-DNA glycosylase family 4
MRRLFPDNNFVPAKQGKGLRLVIAEAPGSEEAETGEPLVGGAGKWFNAMLPQAGLRREDLTLVNCINCQPPKNVFPTDLDARVYISQDDAYASVSHCIKSHVLPVLNGRPWTRVDLLGAKALRFIGEKDGGIEKWRGSPIPVPAISRDKLLAVPTLHPAAIMRDQTMLPVVINDLRKTLTLPPERYNLYPSLEDVRAFKAKVFAFDIETVWTKKPNVDNGSIIMVGLSAGEGEALVVPFSGAYIAELRRIFADATEVVGQNCIQFDLPILLRNGIVISDACQVWDVMLMQHLRFPDLPHDLEFIASQFTNKPAWKHDKGNFELYNARDTDCTWQAFKQLLPILEGHKLLDLYKNVQIPLARICHLMSETGVKVDPANITKLRAELTAQNDELEKLLPSYLQSKKIFVRKRLPAPPGTLSSKTGKPLKFVTHEIEERKFPWRSSDLVAKWLYEDLALEPVLDIKTGEITTGKIALERLARKTGNKGINALRKLRKNNSLLTLFAKEEMTSAGYMHTHFNVHGTASGRLSSSDPNLQNIPESARFLYVPSRPGWKIIECDYSQIESRLTAFLAGDKPRLQRFIDDPSFSEHKFLASKLLNIPYESVEKSADPDSPYIKAKKVVHGTNYGEGALKISKLNDLDFKEVKKVLDTWKNLIQDTVRWQERTASEAKRLGYLTTPFGRKRWFYTASAYTESLSFLPQSTAADIIFRAMIGLLHERISWPLPMVHKVVTIAKSLPSCAKLLLQVHDSLLFECPAENVDEVVSVIKEVMEQPWPELNGFKIPIGIHVGDSWGEAE